MVSIRGWQIQGNLDSPAFLLIHDVGESTQMYKACARYFAENKFSCYGFDQRGHGNSTDTVDRILSFEDLVQDLIQVVSWIRHLHNGVPPVLVGQGYGCLISAELLVKFPSMAQALVLAAPTIELTRDLKPAHRRLISVLSEVYPKMRLPKFLRPRFSNPRHKVLNTAIATRIVKSLLSEDDLPISAGLAWELLQAMERFPKVLEKISKPVLVVLPEADEVAKYTRVKDLLNRLTPNLSIELKELTGLHHNSFTESSESMASIVRVILDWQKIMSKSRS
jgi:alpha-beta hydrolase superfamily lysophospholipase